MESNPVQLKDVSQITSRIGHSLIVIQKAEALLKASLIISLGVSDADAKLSHILNEDKSTLGMLLNQLKVRVELPVGFSTTLSQFLQLRNLFIHNLFLQSWFNFSTREGLLAIDIFLTELLNKASVAIRIFTSFALSYNNEDSNKNLELFDKLMERILITAVPGFGTRTFEEYLQDFNNDLKTNYQF